MKESIITLVGFLGAGKTTLLKHLVASALENRWQPHVILNDYVDATLDAQRINDALASASVNALTGSCICCDGIDALRDSVNGIAPREGGMTFIEANGTSDASRLMEFLGVGLDDRFLPPIQVSVVDVRNWQRRGLHDELEAEQIKVSSLVVLTHLEGASEERTAQVEAEVGATNPFASITSASELDVLLLPTLAPVENGSATLPHSKTHWSSCSVDLPELPDVETVGRLCDLIPPGILRIKGCTKVGGLDGYTHFERCPDGEVYLRPYHGTPVTGPKMLSVGPGSEPGLLRDAVARALDAASSGTKGRESGRPTSAVEADR